MFNNLEFYLFYNIFTNERVQENMFIKTSKFDSMFRSKKIRVPATFNLYDESCQNKAILE